MSHNVHKFTLDVTFVQKGVQLVTKVCYYLEFSYIYKHLINNKKALCLIAEGCTLGVHITNCLSVTYAVLFSDTKMLENIPQHLVRGDFAEDGAEVVEGFAEVLGKKVGGEGGVQAFAYALEAGPGLGEGLDVAGIGDHGAVFL